MPLYEYQCRKCGRRFERIQKFSDEPQSVCEECGGAVERLLSAPAFHFKGTGWYVTDYARKSTSSSESSGNGRGKSAEKSAEKPASSPKSESKPAQSPSEKS